MIDKNKKSEALVVSTQKPKYEQYHIYRLECDKLIDALYKELNVF